jgi:hypothetical protein
MGTNYYHRFNACECCKRYDERHICKSMTSFQGFRPDPDWPDDSTVSITSWAGWKQKIRADGEVWDEYGRQWDVEQFIADVETTSPESRRRQYDWMVEHNHRYGGLDHDWLDADGFSFTDTDFS